MILFDFGDTISINETEPDFIHGTKKVMELVDNTNGVSPEQVQIFARFISKNLIRRSEKSNNSSK